MWPSGASKLSEFWTAWQEADRFATATRARASGVGGPARRRQRRRPVVLEARGVDLVTARAALGRLADAACGRSAAKRRRVARDAWDRLARSGGLPSRPLVVWLVGLGDPGGDSGAGSGVGRVPRTPLGEPPMLIGQALHHAGEGARALGFGVVGPELLLLGVVTDMQTPWPRCMNNRWRRQLHASVGLPEGYRGAAGPLLESCGVDIDELGAALVATLGAAVP